MATTGLLGWRELTARNIKTIQEIMASVPSRDRTAVGALAFNLIKEDRFESVTARWNAFHNALRIVSEGFFGGVAPETNEESFDTDIDLQWAQKNYPGFSVKEAKRMHQRWLDTIK